jgi:hypothetical protein
VALVFSRVAGRGLLVAAAVLAPLHHAAAQTREKADSVRGRVTTDSGAVISGADVIVTIAPSTNTVRQTTDSAGRYALAIPEGTGEYILYIGAAGRKAFRLRLTRTGKDSTFVVDAKLASLITTVATVRVAARKPHPSASLNGDGTTGTSGNDKTVDGVVGALPPDLATNIDAMATLIPGLAVGSGGISAFGMSSDANNTTLNGMNFSGGDLPRDLRTTTRFQTSPWDPTIGGAAGANINQSIAGGGNIASRTAHVTFDDPSLQFSDPIASHIGQEYSNISLSEGGAGAYALDQLFYSYGLQLSRRTASVASLNALDAAALSLSGVSRDSASKLLQTLGALGVPVSAGAAPRLTTTTLSFAERIDHRLPTIPQGSTPLPSWSLTALGSYKRADPTSLSPSAISTLAGTNTNASGMLLGSYIRYFGKDGGYLNELSSAVSYSDNRGTPYLSLPGGNVLISSMLADGTTGLGSLSFGGNSALASDSKAWTWELKNQTDHYASDSISRPMKLFLLSRFDGFSMTPSANRLGSFGFPSLGALASNTPSTFSRTLNSPETSGTVWNGAAALGGSFTKGKLSLTGGLRAEGNIYLDTPAENPQVESLFGMRTDHAPNTFAILPRVGFVYRIPGQQGGASYFSPLSRLNFGPSQIRGGFGAFRQTARASLLSGAMANDGLPGGARRILCTGAATPTPDWSAFAADTASIPSTCVNTSTLADTAPAVTLFDRKWNVPESWRATLGYSKTLLDVYLSVDANYSLNLNQPGTYDLNFAGTPRFMLANEASRPVYVSASNIDPSSGAVSSVQSRTSPEFGRVADQVSDLRGEARPIIVYAVPTSLRFGTLTFAYTYTDARAQLRGFDASTAGDPRLTTWAPGQFTPHHLFQIGLGHGWKNWGVTTQLILQSGLPFTPLVSGDVNGDGSSNDRAFVYNPATATDPALASDLRTLMASGPPAARDCLAKQVGQIAALNSCTGPWSASMNAYMYYSPASPFTGSRAHASLSFQNVLGGVDELLHGSAHLQGWGMSAFPDQTLLRVRGFDPTSNSFLYSVNPRFGSTSIATTSTRVPFRITLDISLDVGPSFQQQELEQNLRMRPALVGTHAPMDSVKARYMQRNFSDFFGYLLTTRMRDSLALTIEQMRQMEDERQALRHRADSIYTILATHLVNLPENYDRKATIKQITETADSVWKQIDDEGKFLQKTLTPGQIRLLPGPLLGIITAPNIRNRFFFGF